MSHNLADVLRKLTARKRDFRREWSLEKALDQSASRVEQWLAAEQSSPSRQAIRQEELLRMAESLADASRKPAPGDRAASLAGRPLAEIAVELGTTKSAVAGLLHRGLKALRTQSGTLNRGYSHGRNPPMHSSEAGRDGTLRARTAAGRRHRGLSRGARGGQRRRSSRPDGGTPRPGGRARSLLRQPGPRRPTDRPASRRRDR